MCFNYASEKRKFDSMCAKLRVEYREAGMEESAIMAMYKYYRDLLSVKAVSSKYKRSKNEFLTPHTVREIHELLRNAFNQAVKWELMSENPIKYAALPKGFWA